MVKRFSSVLWILMLALTTFAQPVIAQPAAKSDGSFVHRNGANLEYKGKPFRFAGTNNYYLMYKSQFMVDDVLNSAAAARFEVIRMWGSLDIGNQDGTNSINGKSDGIYFQYWDGTAPAYNDGADGLQKLDYAIYKAGQSGIKVVIPFVNNWNAFGGIDQYVRWANGQYHDQFYTDPAIRQWYKDWIAHLLNRTNSYTGVQYMNDPTIMTWELANEPRCLSAGAYPRSANCTTETLTTWADEMSTFIKSIDKNHLVSVGDEGFYCVSPTSSDWTENCGEGVDTLAFANLPNIDVMSFHLYPDGWGKTIDWGTDWIKRHFADAATINKPAMLGEFGLLDKNIRNPVYQQWTDAVFKSGGSGALYWILSGKQDDGSLYPDYDGFTVYCPSPVCTTLTNFSRMMMAGKYLSFAPVADNDTVVTDFNTPVVIHPLDNDITYNGAKLVPGSVDLDPLTDGQQTSMTVSGGTFVTNPDGTVTFTPTEGVAGKSQVSYVVKTQTPAASRGVLSNAATILVTVKPDPQGALLLYGFENGVEGWALGNWQTPDGNSVAQITDWATEGTHSLKVVSTGNWFGLDISNAIDLSNKTRFKYDLKTFAGGTSALVALKLGDSWAWNQLNGTWTPENTTTTVDLDLTGLSSQDLSKLHGIYIWFNAGTFYIDNVRAE